MPTIRFRDIATDWSRYSDKVQELCAREEAIIMELHTLQKRENRFLAGGSTRALRPPAPVHEKVRSLPAAVLAILGDSAPPPPPPPEPAPADPNDPLGLAYRLGDELENIREAIKLLHPALNKARAADSRAYANAVSEEYAAVASPLLAALVALGDAARNHDLFIADMAQQGAEPAFLKPVPIGPLNAVIGSVVDRKSGLREIFANAAEGGHFDITALPAAWTVRPAEAPAPKTKGSLAMRVRQALTGNGVAPLEAWAAAEIIGGRAA